MFFKQDELGYFYECQRKFSLTIHNSYYQVDTFIRIYELHSGMLSITLDFDAGHNFIVCKPIITMVNILEQQIVEQLSKDYEPGGKMYQLAEEKINKLG